jgi:hypothetical protein
MMSFSFSGGVEVYGFISPTDITDEYPVIDPLYGIDGFRNVNTLSDLNSIPNLRRRAGMVVGVSGGTTYYKLNAGPWNQTISDWSLFNPGSFTGGTGSCITELYVENIHSCTTGITIHNTIIPNLDNTIDIGVNSKRFRKVNTVEGESTVWVSTIKITTPEIDLGLDTQNELRVITADSSIINNDILTGGNY